MRIGILQYRPRYLDREGNLDTVEGLLKGAPALDLLVLPELFASGYFFRRREDLELVAEPIPEGPTTEAVLRWARQLNAVIVAGLPERVGEHFYNSALIASPTGVVDVYRKAHLFYEEKRYFSPGPGPLRVYDLGRFRLGVMICYDWRFPECARTLALKGAEIIAHPSNLVRPEAQEAIRIRALENRLFIATANRWGQESNGKEVLRFTGHSQVVDPNGERILFTESQATGLFCVDIDPALAREKRITAWNDLFLDRRPDLYEL